MWTLFMFERLSGAMREQGYSRERGRCGAEPEPAADRIWSEATGCGARLCCVARSRRARRRQQARRQHPEKSRGRSRATSADPALLDEAAETALFAALAEIAPHADAAFAAAITPPRCRRSPRCKAPVDAFFDSVMVNADDPALQGQPAGAAEPVAPGHEPGRGHVASGGLILSLMKLIILDRDGVINFDSDQFIKNPEEWKPIPGSLEAIARLTHEGWRVVVATNQSGMARGLVRDGDAERDPRQDAQGGGAGRRAHRGGVLLPACGRHGLRLPQAQVGTVR